MYGNVVLVGVSLRCGEMKKTRRVKKTTGGEGRCDIALQKTLS